MNKKALGPVVASIILIAVTIIVCIAVAAWMGKVTFSFMQIKANKVTHYYFDFCQNFTDKNIDVLFSKSRFNEAETLTKQTSDLELFLNQTHKFNVSYLITDYWINPVPSVVYISRNSNTVNVITTYYFWFYVDLPNVGKTAFALFVQDTAWFSGGYTP